MNLTVQIIQAINNIEDHQPDKSCTLHSIWCQIPHQCDLHTIRLQLATMVEEGILVADTHLVYRIK